MNDIWEVVKGASLRILSDSQTKREASTLLGARCGGSRLQNGSGSGEDAGRTLVGDFLFGFEPVLNVSAADVRAVEAKRFATN